MTTRSDQAPQLGKLIAGAAVGALAMYLLDPERGASRRAAAAGKLREVGRDTTQAMSGAVQELAHRAGAADVFHATDSDTFEAGLPAQRRLVPQALRSLLSRASGAIEPGQDTGTTAARLRERAWDPLTRNSAMWGGLGLFGMVSLFTRRTPLALAAGLAGAAVLARGTRSQPLGGLMHSGSGAPVDIEKTIRIDATPEQVYDLWAHYANFPRFMANVAEVRDLGAGLSHWVIKGPAGTACEFNSVLTEQSRPHRLVWRSVPGGDIEQSGEVRFEPFHGGTRATVRLRYTPPAGTAGQVFATLLGSTPKAQLEEDLQRMKSLLERGSLIHANAPLAASGSKFLH